MFGWYLFWDPTTKRLWWEFWSYLQHQAVSWISWPSRRLFAPVAPYYSSDPALLLKAWMILDVKIPQAFPGASGFKPLAHGWCLVGGILWGLFDVNPKNVAGILGGSPTLASHSRWELWNSWRGDGLLNFPPVPTMSSTHSSGDYVISPRVETPRHQTPYRWSCAEVIFFLSPIFSIS